MKKQLKLDKKRLLIFVAVVIVVIAVVVLIVKVVNNNEEKIIIDGNASSIDDGQNVTDESSQVEYDGNPYNVPQDYTQTLNEFVGETGETLDEATLNEVKTNINDEERMNLYKNNYYKLNIL